MTDSTPSELLDVLDDSGQPTGVRKDRGAVHRDGDWHRTFHLWVIDSDGLILFQRRATAKTVEPGRIDVSVGGHFGAGEGLSQVLREVEEELGFSVHPDELTHLHSRRTERFYDSVTDREFQDVYAVLRDAPLDSYQLDCSEVSVLYEVPITAAIRLFESLEPVAAAGWDCQGRHNNALLFEDDLILRARQETVQILKVLHDWWQVRTGS